MADTNLKPGTTIAKTQLKLLAGNTEKHEVVRKNNDRSLPEKAEPKVLRNMIVSYVNIRHYDSKTNRTKRYTRSASLRLNGTWMEEAGFTTGTKIDVRVMPGCLVITARPTDTPLIQVLNKTTELPEDEQRRVMAFLQGVMARVELEKL
ncbi:SymE family type I addiction module toxin [Enterobacteriaceae bacterium H20N1]|uniref:SymE family type I addiction module toxin n=1 Tax=Dryocola boscaweniae TaxID=2925397 RepID=A0A9X2W6A6_9ENTR|nr:SymE family type I addiction module toxin [Dryocola boscaweniae]MCT4701372.1 SymE family type I addiction module toxin [Dryocola boscaweniae]MCT4718717.1 SymE family type I addiction module toxin [Dryocola boscaweniae]